MGLLVSPTDSELATILRAPTSWLVESYGADVLAATNKGLVGIQRKTVEDLLASLIDGRLGQLIEKMQSLAYKVLILEGYPEFTTDGVLIMSYSNRWNKGLFRNLLRSLWYVHGIRIELTADLVDTADAILELVGWLNESRKHNSLLHRPKSQARNDWGKPDARSWARYFLQGFTGIGPETATALFDHFGRVPLRWDCTPEELQGVFGIGPVTAKHLWRTLEGPG